MYGMNHQNQNQDESNTAATGAAGSTETRPRGAVLRGSKRTLPDGFAILSVRAPAGGGEALNVIERHGRQKYPEAFRVSLVSGARGHRPPTR